MLRQLGADDHRFRALTFQPGLNILVADVTPGSRETDSRNGAGKSSMIELLHFLLGERADSSTLVLRPELRGIEFNLLLDWPQQTEPLRVSRTGARTGWVHLEPLPPAADRGQLELSTGHLRVSEWQRLIGRDLFGLPDDHAGISGRNLLSFLIRRTTSQGYNSAVRSHGRQSDTDAVTNLAYLLGLDWHLADRYRLLKARDTARTQMQKAAQDPLLGRIIGKVADLRSEIALAEQRARDLERQVADFRVVPEYERLREQADQLDQRIRQLRARDVVDRRNLQDLDRALEETTDPDISYLEPVYAELGVMLTDQVRRRFDEVEAFHQSVVRNRRSYLDEEANTIRQQLADSETERQRLGEQLASILRTLQEGGALAALTTLQQVLGQQQALLSALRHRYEAAQALEATKREIRQARLTLQQEMDRDIEARRGFIDEATLLFSEFAQRLYGSDRTAYLKFEASDKILRIQPHIDSDNSAGIGSMVIFCFDLTVSILAHRAGRAPDFLVHDSHLFDGVDGRQLAAALFLAAEVTAREGLQYIITLNSDDLDKARRWNFIPDPYLLPQRLADRYENGGLFGFRF
ncbi:ABC-three component system protein [Frankia sp. CiP3]|uniref:ABC-three component system protein n=1 Tax=Frankia sp. CiP3 TaxID=2880971 RepID=UPI001EF454B1|nr:ABC-three component system protein [Frankia sp. CiP3]